MNTEQLFERYNQSKQYKDRWLSLYKDLYLYVIPDRDAFNVKFNYIDIGKPTTLAIWDSTAMLAAYKRANDLHGLLMPSDRVWGKLIMDPHLFSEEQIHADQEIMDEINDNIFFYLNESNLSRVVSSSNLDLVGGMGVIWVESHSDEEPLYFRSVPAVATYIEYSTDDLLNTCWYQNKMTGRQVLNTFPKYNGKNKDALLSDPNDQFTVIYGQIMITSDKFYMYAVLEMDPFTLLWERESPYQQIIIYRDRVRPGEAEGRGIGQDLLPTIRDLNRIVEYDRKSLAFKANPPLFYDADKYFNPYSIRQWAGAMIARAPGGKNPVEALIMPHSPEVMERVLDLRKFIQDGFQVDPLGEVNEPVKSATEVAIRDKRAQRTSVTDISRLINELPRQVYYVAAKILSQRRLVTSKKHAGLNLKQLKFNFVSPLYDLQKDANLNRLQTDIQYKESIYGQGGFLLTANPIEINNWLCDQLNLPRKLFKSDAEMGQALQRLQQGAESSMKEGSPPQIQGPQNAG